MNLKGTFILSIVILTTVCCATIGKSNRKGHVVPAAIIYKTKGDYSKNVPITLSTDKSKIVSYPAPQDVYYRGQLAYPTVLKDGFLLDNRGISANSVFIKLTYEEYSKLSEAPSNEELYKMILDKNPFKEIYNVGNRRRFKDEVSEINQLIETHKLKGFKRVK